VVLVLSDILYGSENLPMPLKKRSTTPDIPDNGGTTGTGSESRGGSDVGRRRLYDPKYPGPSASSERRTDLDIPDGSAKIIKLYETFRQNYGIFSIIRGNIA